MILNLILEWRLDVVLFGALALAAMLLSHRFVRRRSEGRGLSVWIWLVLAGTIAVGGVAAEWVGERERLRLRNSLEGIAPTYAAEFEEEGHAAITLDTSPEDPRYLGLIARQKNWLRLNHTVNDIYTFRLKEDGTVVLLVDSETDYDRNGVFEGEREERTAIGEPYPEADESLLAAFDGNLSFDGQPYTDRWGTWVSTYVPLRDAEGRVEAVLGVDYAAIDWLVAICWQRGWVVACAMVLAAIVVGGGTTMTLLMAQVERRRQSELEAQRYARKLEQTNQELDAARAAAVAASRAKSDFLANMSHEIRTPMTAILGFSEMLTQEGDLSKAPPRRVEIINTIRRNGQHLLQVINDVLDVSKIEAGAMTVERIPFELPRIIADVISLMGERAADKKLALGVELASPIPRSITADPTRLRQILINLLGNAIKFTSQGGVKLRVGIETGAAGRRDSIRFDIIDTGIGMTDEQVGNLFRPFAQADSTTTRRFGGTGLGLTIARRLAELLGGGVTVRSAKGVGSTFTATIDPGPIDAGALTNDLSLSRDGEPQVGTQVPAAAPQADKAPVGASVKGVRVLLAEDGPDNQRLIAFHLRRAGCELTIVENGELAVDAALAAGAGGTPFDVILMDMQMPVMDGYTAAGALRERGYAGPIIALTAHAMASDRERCLAAGCSDYATKPINAPSLLRQIASSAASPGFRTPAEPVSVAALPEASVACPPAEPIYSTLDDPDLAELVVEFAASLQDRVREIEATLRSGDLATLTRLAHQLKGAGSSFGFEGITRSAAALETGLKTQEPLDVIAAEAAELVNLCTRARATESQLKQTATVK